MAVYPIPKGESMATMTLAERIAETRRAQAENIAAAEADQRYRRAFLTVKGLRREGWQIEVWDAIDGTHIRHGQPWHGPHLCVTFAAPDDCRCTGSVSAADGSLSGEPVD